MPITLTGAFGSFSVLRDGAAPYPADVTAVSGDTRLHFAGTATDPFNVDGMKGRLDLLAPTTTTIVKIAGMTDSVEAALQLGGTFAHDDPVWHLGPATGALNKDTITAADLMLTEGAAGAPDRVAVDLSFEQLDADPLLGGGKAAQGAGADRPLVVERHPDTLIETNVAAGKVTYAGFLTTGVTIAGSVKPGKVTVDALSLGYLGAPFKARGQIEAVTVAGNQEAGHVSATVDMDGVDFQALRQLLNVGAVPITGRVNGSAQVDATGATVSQAMRDSRTSAVLEMGGGSIARQIVELASTDARALFRKANGMTPITCVLGIIDIRGGAGTVSPLRIRSVDGTITGRGTFDILRRQLDLTVASESRTTGLFALDVPMHISGSFQSPNIRPAVLSAAGRAQLSQGDDIGRLLPGLQPFARRSPCLSR